MDKDELLCYLISNPYKTNRSRRKINYVDEEIYKLIIKKYPKYIINYDDLNLIFEYLEEKLILNKRNP